MKRFCPFALRCAALGSLALLPGCSDHEITAYRIPKEVDRTVAEAHAHAGPNAPGASGAATTPAAAASAPAAMTGSAVATASGASLTWTAPAHWQSKTASAMRKGSFTINGDAGATAELAITAFPGDVGGESANVNRWRGQLQLPPLAAAEASAAITRLQAGSLAIGVTDFVSTGAEPMRMLGAMVPFEGATWFFKLTGPDALVAREKPSFLAFLQTLKPAAPAAKPTP